MLIIINDKVCSLSTQTVTKLTLIFSHMERKMGINGKHYGTISLALKEGSVSVEIIK